MYIVLYGFRSLFLAGVVELTRMKEIGIKLYDDHIFRIFRFEMDAVILRRGDDNKYHIALALNGYL